MAMEIPSFVVTTIKVAQASPSTFGHTPTNQSTSWSGKWWLEKQSSRWWEKFLKQIHSLLEDSWNFTAVCLFLGGGGPWSMHGTEHESETFVKYIVLLATPFNSPAFLHKPCMPKTAPQRCYSSVFFQKDRTPIVATKRCTLWCVILMGKVGGNLLQTVWSNMQTLDGTKCGKCWWKWFLWASPQFIEFTSSWSHWWVFLNYKLSVARSYDDYWWLMRAIHPLWHPPQIVGWWGYQRPVPKEADFALDIFQRTFPEVTTEDLLNGGQSARVNVFRFFKRVHYRRYHGYLSLFCFMCGLKMDMLECAKQNVGAGFMWLDCLPWFDVPQYDAAEKM